MRRWLSAVALIPFIAQFVGCSNDSFVPAAKTKRTSSSSPSVINSTQRAPEVTFILPEDMNEDLKSIEPVARLELGASRAVFNLVQPPAGSPPTKQAELIRDAVQRGASGIVVVPNKSKDTADAIAAIDQKKCPVVLMGRPLTGVSTSAATLVTWPNFTVTANEIVAAISEDCKRAGMPDDAPVLLLKSEPADETSAAREAALTAAIKATKHPIAAVVPIIEETLSRNSLVNALKANPKVCAVISDDTLGLQLAGVIRSESKTHVPFMVGGYCNSPKSVAMSAMNQHSILVDRARDNIVRRAIGVVLERIEGKTVPEKVEVELGSRRSSIATVAPAPPAPPILPDLFPGQQK